MDISTIKSRVSSYKKILKNTKEYRSAWVKEVKPFITKTLEEINTQSKLGAKVICKDNMENLGAVILSLGKTYSGIAEKVDDSDAKRRLIKSNGSLVFQKLFNGKIMIMIIYPYIDGYGQPQPPKNLEIVRPHELTEPFMIRYVEEFLKEIIDWEDYDDDEKEGLAFNTIGFQNSIITEED